MRWFFEVVPRPLASGSQNLVTFGIRWVTGSTDWWLNSPGASFLAINGDRYWCNNQLKIYCFRRGVWPGFGHGSCNGNWGSNNFRPCAVQVVAFTGRPLVSLAKESLVVFREKSAERRGRIPLLSTAPEWGGNFLAHFPMSPRLIFMR